MKIKNDDDLIKYAKIGNEEAIKLIYDNTYQKSYIIAKSMLKNDEDIADVLQNAYVIAFTKLEQIENAKLYKSWVYKIVNRTCLNEYKKRIDIPFSDIEKKYEVDIKDTNQEFIPDKKINYEHDKQIIHKFINELPFEQKSALIMKYFEELKIKEIAEIFECSENTIKSRINYAKKFLEQKIQTYKKQGNTLFTLPLVPFIVWVLKEDAKAIEIPKLILNTSSIGFLEQIASKIKKIIPQKKHISKVLARKAIISCCSLAAVTGGLIIYKNNQKNSTRSTQVTVNENLEKNVTSNENQRNEYIFPNSDKEYLTSKNIESIPESMLPFARNEIFARHGRKFSDEKYTNYFESKSWYKGTIDPEEFDKNNLYQLNKFEKANIDLIKFYESQNSTWKIGYDSYNQVLNFYKSQQKLGFKNKDYEFMNSYLCDLYNSEEGKGIELYYTFIDLSNDGIPELFLSDKNVIFNTFSLWEQEGQICEIVSPHSGYMGKEIIYEICENNMIKETRKNEKYETISYLYLPKHESDAIYQDTIVKEGEHYYFGTIMYNIDNDEDEIEYLAEATEADYNEMKNKYPLRKNIRWKKISEYQG